MPVQDQKMERRTITVPERQIEEMEKKVSSGEYPNFSEVVRSAMREFIQHHPNTPPHTIPAQEAST
jgi:Arc/MetJ-type ribon-helix-helix transcriptional regulator